MCYLDAISTEPFLLFGCSVIILFAAIVLMCIATIALIVVKWIQYRKEKEKKQTNKDGKQEPQI